MNSKFCVLIIVMVLGCPILAGPKLAAQDSNPSLDETISFLIDKTEFVYDVGSESPYGRKWKLESPHRCTLLWTTEDVGIPRRDIIRGKIKQADTIPLSITLSLADINPRTIGYDSALFSTLDRGVQRQRLAVYDVYLSTDNRKVITFQDGHGTRYSSSLSVKFQDKQMAARYGKALSHAINVCGGGKTIEKKEPF